LSKSDVKVLLDNSEIVKEFPHSGQKQVFLVIHKTYGLVVVKFVKSGDERIQREINIVTEHEIMNVPKILDVKEIKSADDEVYVCIIEQYIEGVNLCEKLKTCKLNTIEGVKLLKILLQIAVKLEEINVVHRDIKPGNIICGTGGSYYLIDFGIARQLDRASLTMTHAVVGPHTPGYGAPELFQYSKKDIDIRADLFSIGVVMFEALTGEHPFITGDEMNVNEIWYKTKTVLPKSFKIEGDSDSQLISFIQTLMQKHITRRPPNAKKAFEWLNTLLPTIDFGGI
jgi:serine/threonine-protein kinase